MAKKRILLVEDHEDVYEFVSLFLEDKGYLVAVAKDGREGIDKVKEFRPDLVILDLMMPRMDGFSVLKLLMGMDAPPKVLVLSAIQKMEGVEEAMRLGASGYVTKPVEGERLLKKVQSLVS